MKAAKIYAVLIGVMCLVLFNSCQKEESYVDDTVSSESRFIIKNLVSYEEINQNVKISEFLIKYNEKKAKNTSKTIVHDSINNFYIDTSEAIYLEEEDYHSYTFLIYRGTTNNVLENLVLALNTDGSYDTCLWLYQLDSNGFADTTEPIGVTKLEGFDNGVLFTPKNNPCVDGLRVEVDYMNTEGEVFDDLGDCESSITNNEFCISLPRLVPCGQGGGSSGTGDGDGDPGDGDGDPGDGDGDPGDGDGDNGTGDGDSGSQGPGGPGGGAPDTGNDDGGNPVITTPKKADGSSAASGFLISALGLDDLDVTLKAWINEPNNLNSVQILMSHLSQIGINTLNINFILNVINYLDNSPSMSLNYILNNRTELDTNQTEDSNYTIGGYDTTSYGAYNPQSTWPTVASLFSTGEFIGWGATGVERNCFEYAKAQIAVKNYEISSYFASGQTIQLYTTEDGVDTDALSEGLAYLTHALSNSIPVIVGIDSSPGSPNPQTDNSTDHFVVIVGMGSDDGGDYFRFFDNASGDVSQGTHLDNKLYYDSVTGIISGTSETNYATGLTYILTMIRKSKVISSE